MLHLRDIDTSELLLNTSVMETKGETATATFSELLRSPNDVAAAAEHGSVTITRRDGQDLVLTTAQAAQNSRNGLRFAASIVAAAVVDSPTTFVQGLHTAFPWMIFLSQEEQQQLADELVSLARGCAAVDRFQPLSAAVQGWEATAQAYAAGIARDGSDIDWLTESESVSRPA
jgi:hypothetical protein